MLAASVRSTAQAEDAPRGPFRLAWVRGERTESCADRAAIADGVERRLGRSVFSDSAPRSIETVVQHEGDVWEAHIYVRGDDGTLDGSRILSSRGSTCAGIEAAATLAIALAIDPEAALGPPPSPASAVLRPAPVPVPSPSAATPPAPCPTPEAPQPAPAVVPPPCPVERPCPPNGPSPGPSSRGAATLRAIAALGLLPATSPGVALSVDLPAYRFVHAAAGVLYLPEQRTANRDDAFGLTVAWLGVCARPVDSSRTSLSFCASGQAGGIHSVVFALEPAQPGDQVWVGASVGGVFRARVVGPLEAEVGADLVVPVTRYAFTVQGAGTAFRGAPVAGVGFLGAGMSIP